jgi:hypothetical protein
MRYKNPHEDYRRLPQFWSDFHHASLALPGSFNAV